MAGDSIFLSSYRLIKTEQVVCELLAKTRKWVEAGGEYAGPRRPTAPAR